MKKNSSNVFEKLEVAANEQRKKLLSQNNPEAFTSSEYAEAKGLGERNSQRILRELLKKGIIKRTQKYVLNTAGRVQAYPAFELVEK